MTHHRQNFERVYALTETVAPAHLIRQSSQAEANRFLIKKEISLTRFLTFLGTNNLDAKAIPQPLLRQQVSSS